MKLPVTVRLEPQDIDRVERLSVHWKRDKSETLRMLAIAALDREEEILGWREVKP